MYSLLIGRFQPFHKGHKAIIDKLLDEGKNVCVAVMDTAYDPDRNPYLLMDRMRWIAETYVSTDRVKIISIPQINEAVYGRDVGYDIREVRFESDIEEISGTKIREEEESWKSSVQ